MVGIAELKGQTMASVVREGDDAIVFTTTDGLKYRMHHLQNCCECVSIEEIAGDLEDLVGAPLLVAEEVNSEGTPPMKTESGYEDESYTWTFYKLATRKGYVDIRWYGTSSGYYSESVDITRE